MKVFEENLIIGDEYYLDDRKISKGFFIGFDKSNDPMFYPTKNMGDVTPPEQNGTIDFPKSNFAYEEV